MSGAEAPTAYGTIVVVGGGCYGSYYVTQLRRARAAGALSYDRVVAVDRDPACRVARMPPDDRTTLVVEDWTTFFDTYFASASPHSVDAIVPSPMMPHLMYDWMRRRAAARWPERAVTTEPLPRTPDVPWHRDAPDGTQYVSFATWMCPINCIEPRRCPHTRGERSWTMPATVKAIVAGPGVDDAVVLHCTHRAYGVGMFDTRDVLAGDARIAALGATGDVRVVVGTVSHCHGALNLLRVAAP